MSSAQALLDFDERSATRLVTQRLNAGQMSAATRTLLTLASHLHDVVRELRPTREDWREAIAFLTEVGHASDEKRQEWVLLSDIDYEGFHAKRLAHAVERDGRTRWQAGRVGSIEGPTRRISGGSLGTLPVHLLDERRNAEHLDGMPAAGAEVETWQANAEGWYENQEPDRQPEWNGRGVFRSDADGCFSYLSVRPAGYSLPADGPVGRLFTQIGLSLIRPAPLHFVIRAAGFETITTEVFDADDPHLAQDALFGPRKGLLGRFESTFNAGGQQAWSLRFTFVMVRAKKARNAA